MAGEEIKTTLYLCLPYALHRSIRTRTALLLNPFPPQFFPIRLTICLFQVIEHTYNLLVLSPNSFVHKF